MARQIARETMEVWATHVRSGEQALVESHQESFPAFERAGIRIKDRSVIKHLAHWTPYEDKVVRRAAREELKKILSLSWDNKKSKKWVVEDVLEPSTYEPVYVPEVDHPLHLHLLDVPEVAHPLHLHLETALGEESGWFEATADALVQIGSFDPFGQVGTSDPAVIEALINRLDDESPWTGVVAVETLCQIAPFDPAVTEALIEWLDDADLEEWRVCMAAVEALNQIGASDPEVTEALIERLDDEEWWVREAAAWALGQIGPSDPAAAQALIERFDDEKWKVREAAVEALGEISPSNPAVTQSLIDRLGDEDRGVFRVAAKAVGQIGLSDPAVIEALTGRLDGEPSRVREAAAKALGRIGFSDPAVVKALFDPLTGESIREESPRRKRTAEVMGALPWRVFSEAQTEEELRERVDEICQESTEDRGIAYTEGEEHLIVHWQELARLPE